MKIKLHFILLTAAALVPALLLLSASCYAASAGHGSAAVSEFPPSLASYNDAGKGILERLSHRASINPFNVVGSLIFSFSHSAYLFGRQVYGKIA